jgi:pyridoxal phosphate enzyme (YggS family)
MSDIAGNLNRIKLQIPGSVKLVAVSKTRPVNDVMAAYVAGHRLFGENRVQELLDKKDLLPGEINWHLIGHLQTNKVKYIVPFISMIHSVDSFRLLKMIDSEALKVSRIIDCLLQIHIAEEETKFGFSMDELTEILKSDEFARLKNIDIRGVMGMATFIDDESHVREEFRYLKKCFDDLKSDYFNKKPQFSEISMGMSDDYKIAVQEGSTMIRIGSLIFGERTYN